MKLKLEDLQKIRRLFEVYLHQDWSADGDTLEELFDNNNGLGSLKEGLKEEAQLLIDSGLTNQHLDEIFFGLWGAGYEPEAEDFEDWRGALREIVRLCDKHLEMEKQK